MRRTGAAAFAMSLVVAGAVGVAPAPAGAEAALIAGSCLLTLEVTGEGDRIDITTPEQGICVTSEGIGLGLIEGFADKAHDAIPFGCHGGVGDGWADFRVEVYGIPSTFIDTDLKLVNAEGVVKLAMHLENENANFAGTGDMVQDPLAEQDCLTPADPVTWTGVFTFEDPVLE